MHNLPRKEANRIKHRVHQQADNETRYCAEAKEKKNKIEKKLSVALVKVCFAFTRQRLAINGREAKRSLLTQKLLYMNKNWFVQMLTECQNCLSF